MSLWSVSPAHDCRNIISNGTDTDLSRTFPLLPAPQRPQRAERRKRAEQPKRDHPRARRAQVAPDRVITPQSAEAADAAGAAGAPQVLASARPPPRSPTPERRRIAISPRREARASHGHPRRELCARHRAAQRRERPSAHRHAVARSRAHAGRDRVARGVRATGGLRLRSSPCRRPSHLPARSASARRSAQSVPTADRRTGRRASRRRAGARRPRSRHRWLRALRPRPPRQASRPWPPTRSTSGSSVTDPLAVEIVTARTVPPPTAGTRPTNVTRPRERRDHARRPARRRCRCHDACCSKSPRRCDTSRRTPARRPRPTRAATPRARSAGRSSAERHTPNAPPPTAASRAADASSRSCRTPLPSHSARSGSLRGSCLRERPYRGGLTRTFPRTTTAASRAAAMRYVGAGDGTRTRNIQLGKLTLYH